MLLTACGIETYHYLFHLDEFHEKRCNSTYRLRYWNVLLQQVCFHVEIKLQQYLLLAVLKLWMTIKFITSCLTVATVLTACGMRRRVRGSRGAKRRWGPHISSPWLKGMENKGDEVTVLTACGIETHLQKSHSRRLTLPSCNSTYRLRYEPKDIKQ